MTDKPNYGDAVAYWLRLRHPLNTAKLVARDIGCTVKAAENLLLGHLSAKSMTALVSAYGLGFIIETGAAQTQTSIENFLLAEADKAVAEAEVWRARHERLRSTMEAAKKATWQ